MFRQEPQTTYKVCRFGEARNTREWLPKKIPANLTLVTSKAGTPDQ
jgi:hypothetical protein